MYEQKKSIKVCLIKFEMLWFLWNKKLILLHLNLIKIKEKCRINLTIIFNFNAEG